MLVKLLCNCYSTLVMNVFNPLIMLTVHLNYLLLLLSVFSSVCSFPSTPLNERNQEISWEAWLLVDDQNQNRQAHVDGQIPRRRITPKSVFIAPTFSPEDLPPCAEGYSSDYMGRCVKIIKLDEDRHLDFLVSKLNEKFGSSIDYESSLEIEEVADSEPTRIEVPLSLTDYGEDYSNDTPQEELDMAIIVTPKTRDTDKAAAGDISKLDKRDDAVYAENMYEEELKKLLKLATTTTEKYDETTLTLESEQSTFAQLADEALPTSTLPETTERVLTEEGTTVQTVDEMDTTSVATTTTELPEGETTTFKYKEVLKLVQTEEESVDDTTTSTEASTTLEGTTELPTTTTSIVTETTSSSITKATTIIPKITTTTPKITTYHPVATTYHPYTDLSLVGSSRTKNLVKFPDEEVVRPRSHPDGNFVRFPDVGVKYQQESLVHHTRDVDEHTGNIFNNEIITPQPSQMVQELVLPPAAIADGYYSEFHRNHNKDPGRFYSKFFPPRANFNPVSFEKSYTAPLVNEHQYQYQTGTTEKHPLKKTRDKHGGMFVLPPKWSHQDEHKPIVLRFSRKHFNLDTNKFKNSEIYRSLPMEDLTYLFGHKNGQGSHR